MTTIMFFDFSSPNKMLLDYNRAYTVRVRVRRFR